MKIQLKSDLHLEFSNAYQSKTTAEECYVHPDADVLVLAGDITTLSNMDYMIARFKNVKIPILYVPGNHEYYGKVGFYKTLYMMAEKLQNTNITLLSTDFELIEDICFIGATLWTNLANPRDKLLVSKFGEVNKSIKGFSSEDWHHRNIEDVHYIESHLAEFEDNKKVVITHYLPSEQSVPTMYKGNPSNAAFVNNLEHLMLNDDTAPELWLHGHTHDSCDYVVGKTRVVCNPFGYYPRDMNPNYNNSLIIEI